MRVGVVDAVCESSAESLSFSRCTCSSTAGSDVSSCSDVIISAEREIIARLQTCF
uniref:MIP33394p1 n=1 Tax=Drosophila melanogaster TaxID=7227 RepID=H1UUB3_DROME|nr:MIP33394p1 [Drosophila melanogaster]